MEKSNSTVLFLCGFFAAVALVCALAWNRGQIISRGTLLALGIPMLAIGVLLFFFAVTRSKLVPLCWIYWILVPYFLLVPLNRIVTDARLGTDSGGQNWATLEIYLLFMLCIVGPIAWMRWSLVEEGGLDAGSWALLFVCFSFLFVFLFAIDDLQGDFGSRLVKFHREMGAWHTGLSQECIFVSLGMPSTAVCSLLLFRKLRMKPRRALAVSVGLFVLAALVSTQVGFNGHPRDFMAFRYEDFGTVALTYGPFENARDVTREYREGKRAGSPEGASWGDEDYNYLLAIDGLQLLLVAGAVVAGIGLILTESSEWVRTRSLHTASRR